jgi:hypothetical protein
VSEPDDGGLPGRLQHLERLIREMEEGPESPARARARRIVQAVLDLHAEALGRIVKVVTTARGRDLLDDFARDPHIAGVLLLHGLHPLDLDARVHGALDALAPILRGHGVRVAAVATDETAVRVRLEREPGSGGPPAGTLRGRIQDALAAAAPEATTIEVEVPEAPAAFVPVEQVRLRPRTPEARPQ